MTTALNISDEELQDEITDALAWDLFFERLGLEQSLHSFVKGAWHLVEPTQVFEDNWHVVALCSVLEQIYAAQCRHRPFAHLLRTIVNIPPGTMKSLLIEVFFPAWVWAKNPKKRFLTASYGQHLTTRDNLRCRQIIESPWYQEKWPVKLLDDQNTKTRYNTTDSGWRIATSVNGVGTGEHPDFIIIDDPTSAAQAMSAIERTSANDWFDRTVSTRLGRHPAIIVVMQRLHEDDLAGHLLKRGGWTLVRWPMRYEKCTCPDQQMPDGQEMHPDEGRRCPLHKADPLWRRDTRDPRTTMGQLLFPALFPEEKVRQLELDLGPYGAAGQLQQRPSPEGGGLFKMEWFKFVDALPAGPKRVVRGWDTAGTENDGDWTVGVKISEEFEYVIIPAAGMIRAKKVLKSTGRFYVEDVQRGRLGPDGVDKLILATASLDGKEVPVREEKEGGASGKAQITARARLLKGFDYAEVQLGSNKIVRAKPFRAQCEAGNVHLVRAPWNVPYLQVLCAFPTGTHDDDVDGSSCAFNSLLLEEPNTGVKSTW